MSLVTSGSVLFYIYDGGSGSPIPGVSVTMGNETVISDVDGKATLKVIVGTRTAQFSEPWHVPKTIEGIGVVEGSLTLDVYLSPNIYVVDTLDIDCTQPYETPGLDIVVEVQ
jgi:hypothetical protein